MSKTFSRLTYIFLPDNNDITWTDEVTENPFPFFLSSWRNRWKLNPVSLPQFWFVCTFMLGLPKLALYLWCSQKIAVMNTYEVFISQAEKLVSNETWLHLWTYVMVLIEEMADREFLSSSTTNVDIQCVLQRSQLGHHA